MRSQSVDRLLQAAPALPDEEQLQPVAAPISAVDERGLRPFDDDAGPVRPISWAEVKEGARRSDSSHHRHNAELTPQ